MRARFQYNNKILIILILLLTNQLALAGATTPPAPEMLPITVGILVQDISEIDEAKSTIKVGLHQYLSWQDERVAFDPAKYGGSKYIYFDDSSAQIKLQEIWYPNFIVRSIRSPEEIIAQSLIISHDGKVTFIKRYNVVLETNVDMRNYPFDKQNIKINLLPIGKDYKGVKLIIDKKHQGCLFLRTRSVITDKSRSPVPVALDHFNLCYLPRSEATTGFILSAHLVRQASLYFPHRITF